MYKGKSNPNYGNRGPLNPLFKGGRRLRKGYVELYMPDHPMSAADGYLFEHRYVMANHLGRMLSQDEDVHHIDENTLNNDESNLQVLSRSEHVKLHHRKKKIIRDPKTGRIIGVERIKGDD